MKKESNNLYTYNKAILLGNGFDVANGYPTRYQDFIEDSRFKYLLSNDNQLAKHIHRTYEEAKWVDIEIEIGKYSANLEKEFTGASFEKETNRFKVEYNDLSDALYWYINSLIGGKHNPKMAELMNNWKNSLCGNIPERAFFVSFNYLRWDLNEIYKNMFKENFVNEFPLFIHGITTYNLNDTPKIVLGVDENSEHSKKHNFIVKSYNKYSQSEIYFKHIFDASHIIIFGCSIGETDQRYFKKLFSRAVGKTFEIYYYGEKEEANIRANIAALCDFDDLMTNNTVIFKDSSDYSL